LYIISIPLYIACTSCSKIIIDILSHDALYIAIMSLVYVNNDPSTLCTSVCTFFIIFCFLFTLHELNFVTT
jgi:hypothetical protein